MESENVRTIADLSMEYAEACGTMIGMLMGLLHMAERGTFQRLDNPYTRENVADQLDRWCEKAGEFKIGAASDQLVDSFQTAAYAIRAKEQA